jgi:hypothetical protein
MAGVALHNHIGGLEERVGDLGDGQMFVIGILCADNWRIRADREVDPRLRDEVGLELGEIDVERAIEGERRRQGRNDLCDETVQVLNI